MNNTNLLLRHNYVAVPSGNDVAGQEALATVMMNIAYYGFALSTEAYKAVAKLDATELALWWSALESELKHVTGASKKMGDFVVYKNFPSEVLSKSEADYWIPQILMYWGFPNEMFTEPVKPREKMNEVKKASVLHLAKNDTMKNILSSYVCAPARWKDQELQDVLFLSQNLPVNLAKMAFKENLVLLASSLMSNGREINITTATDVLRLAAGLSDGDVSLREKVKFKSFKKPVRRFLLSSMDRCNNLSEDMARRPELWKRLIHQLHPGDYKRSYPNVVAAMDSLYKDSLETFNSKVESLILEKNPKVLEILSTRPGDFRRRLVHMLDVFGDKAANAFISDKVLSGLTTAQIVSLRSAIGMANYREHRVFPPKGNWNKLQIGKSRMVQTEHVDKISKALGKVLSARVPLVKVLDPKTSMIKLPSNDGEVGYTRGTTFPIPDNVQFIRSASYWECKRNGNVWFDNGWNFFDYNWDSKGVISWRNTKYGNGAAAFSGDPTNTKDTKGRACQLIDLYLDKLFAQGVRYAVWNVLCFSRIPFSQAEEVFAALQWGEDAKKGKLFEPSRCQLAFPLKGEQLTKFVCLIDLMDRKMVYLDANLKGSTGAADDNQDILEKTMPAFMEYLDTLPSVHDLFAESVDNRTGRCTSDIHVLYSDKDTELKDVPAYVFKPENKENKFKPVDLNNILST